MGTVVGAELGGDLGLSRRSPQPTPETPAFGSFAYLAVSATELVLVRGKQGLTNLKLTGEIVARVPRTEVDSVQLGKGAIAAALTITLSSGAQWELEVARASKRAAEQVVAELAG